MRKISETIMDAVSVEFDRLTAAVTRELVPTWSGEADVVPIRFNKINANAKMANRTSTIFVLSMS
jgi:hypothetical protein